MAAPLVPDGDEARGWAERELADPLYAAAEPNAFDRVAAAVVDAFAELFSREPPGGLGPVLAVALTVVAVGVVVAALIVWGPPRARRRARTEDAGLFGADAGRTADDLRADADAAAARSDWTEAIILRFRAIAAALTERGVVLTPPGATAQAFARAAARAFPDAGEALSDAAGRFDDVRYLRRPGSAELYARVTGLDVRTQGMRARAPESVGTEW